MWFVGWIACTETGPGPNGNPDGTGTAVGGTLTAGDEHVNTFSMDWVLASSPVPSGEDLFVSWSALEADAWGTERPADGYDTATLLHANASRSTFEQAIERGRPEEQVADAWTAPAAGETSLSLTDLAGFDPKVLVDDAAQSWLFALLDTDGRIRTGLWLDPTDGQSGSNVAIPALGTRVEQTSQFDGDTFRVDAGTADYMLDFAGITTDAYGEPISPEDIGTVFVAGYTGKDEADDLQGDVLDLQTPASFYATVDTGGGSTVSLSDATGTDGSFIGFTADKVWLIGGVCADCGSPVPLWVLTITLP